LDRRAFLGRVGLPTVAAAGVGFSGLLSTETAQAEGIGPGTDERRRDEALLVRLRTALAERSVHLPQHPTNGDEGLYSNKSGSYSKALPHNGLAARGESRFL